MENVRKLEAIGKKLKWILRNGARERAVFIWLRGCKLLGIIVNVVMNPGVS
jgi:hypothetical protein